MSSTLTKKKKADTNIPRIIVSFDHFLAVLAPTVAIIKNVNITSGLHNNSRFPNHPWSRNCLLHLFILFPVSGNPLIRISLQHYPTDIAQLVFQALWSKIILILVPMIHTEGKLSIYSQLEISQN